MLHQALCIISNPSVDSNRSYSPETLSSGQNRQFWSHVTLKFDRWPWKRIGHLFYAMLSFVHHFKAIGKFKLKLQSGNAQFGSKSAIFCSVWLWQITLKNIRAPLLYCFKLCASFDNHQWILTGVTVGKCPIWVKIDVFLSRVTLKFARWSWKTIGQFFYVASSFVHHLKAIGKLKLKLQSGNAQFGSKSAIFCPVWPWNLTDDLKNNRAPLLCCFKLCASFHSHQWILTRVTVRKRLIWVKINNFLAVWPWKLTDDLEKQ